MKILIADDDKITLEVLKKQVQRWGFEVVTAKNGQEALDILLGSSAPEIALLDWMMPVLSGMEVLEKIEYQNIFTPLYKIMITSRGEKEDFLKALQAGANDYIVKPVVGDDLKLRIEMGRYHLELQKKVLRQKSVNFQSSRLESLKDFTYSACLEVNNPLAVAQAALESLLRKHLKGKVLELDQVIENIQMCSRALNRVAELTSSMRQYAALSLQHKVKHLRLKDFLQPIVSSYQTLNQHKGITYSLEGDLDFALNADPSHLEEAFRYIIDNATFAALKGAEPWVKIVSKRSEDQIQIQIFDSGDGIAPEHQSRIFDPFYTADVREPKIGIGLTVADTLIRANGGVIELEPEQKNTCFTIILNNAKF